MTAGNLTARALFAPIAPSYERWAAVLSLGQDEKWRRAMVSALELPANAKVVDIAAGTGSITRLLEVRSADVVAFDQSAQMLRFARRRGANAVCGTAERLPFPDGAFDAVTFGYLLRYVDPASALREIVRVLRPGGSVGMLEFGRPRGFWRPGWWLYTRLALPLAGAVIGSGWREVGSFLGPSIDAFSDEFPPGRLAQLWRSCGLTQIRIARPSLGGGLLMWARKG